MDYHFLFYSVCFGQHAERLRERRDGVSRDFFSNHGAKAAKDGLAAARLRLDGKKQNFRKVPYGDPRENV